jgi:hypothetical protein
MKPLNHPFICFRSGKKELEKPLRMLKSFLGQYDGLPLVCRVVDQPLLVESIESIKIVALPGTIAFVQRQLQ